MHLVKRMVVAGSFFLALESNLLGELKYIKSKAAELKRSLHTNVARARCLKGKLSHFKAPQD